MVILFCLSSSFTVLIIIIKMTIFEIVQKIDYVDGWLFLETLILEQLDLLELRLTTNDSSITDDNNVLLNSSIAIRHNSSSLSDNCSSVSNGMTALSADQDVSINNGEDVGKGVFSVPESAMDDNDFSF